LYNLQQLTDLFGSKTKLLYIVQQFLLSLLISRLYRLYCCTEYNNSQNKPPIG